MNSSFVMTSVEMGKKMHAKNSFHDDFGEEKKLDSDIDRWVLVKTHSFRMNKRKTKKISAWPLLARDGTAYGVYLCAIAIEHVWTMLRPSNCWEFNCPMNRCSINSSFAVFHLNKKESTHFGKYTSRMHSHERRTHLKYVCFFHIWTVKVFFLYCSIIYM